MTSSEYWKKREVDALKSYQKDEEAYYEEIQEIYADMMERIQKEIDSFYIKYAVKEDISMAEAKKRVSQLDIKAYARKAKKYVRNRDFSDEANEEMRLYNATMKINRLEMLKANIGLELVNGYDELQKYFEQTLTDRTLDEFKRQAGILGSTITDNTEMAHSIVNASFHNATFSDRIWMHQDVLKNQLSSLLQTGLIQGRNPRQLAVELRKYFNVSIGNSERLMRTELARVQTAAQKRSFEKNGFEEYEFIANGTACEKCAGLDGQHFKVAKMMPGTNAPPIHPNCRCSTAAYQDSAEYEAWLDFLDKGGSTEEWQQRNRTMNYMSNSFKPDFSVNAPIKFGSSLINVKKITNSHFDMVTDIGNTRRNKAIRLTEKHLREIHGKYPDIQIPKIAVVNFEKHGLNVNAIGGYYKETDTLYINSIYDTKEKIIEFVNKRKGFFANTTEYAPYLHELGHKFYYDSIEAVAKSGGISYNKARTIVDYRVYRYIDEEEIKWKQDEKHSISFLSENISDYADTQSVTEICAEAFSVRDTNHVAQRIIDLVSK